MASNWMLSIKVVLISTVVLFTALILKFSVPVLTEFAFSELPSIWGFVLSWLRPLYLYVVINCIIIIIVASSKLQQNVVQDSPPETVVIPVPVKVPADYSVVYDGGESKIDSVEAMPEFVYGYDDTNAVKGLEIDVYEDAGVPVKETNAMALTVSSTEEMIGEDDLSMSRSLWTPPLKSKEYSFSTDERPPVSVRIGHRKPAKSIYEGGRALGVSKPKRLETLESTWKTITEGRSMPLTRHLRKSDTWETHGRVGHHLQEHDQLMTKSETFNDRRVTATNNSAVSPAPGMGRLRRDQSGSGKLRKESSPGQDELNRRVEAFIKKFNEDMRLQRQESLNQYMEMINRGAH